MKTYLGIDWGGMHAEILGTDICILHDDGSYNFKTIAIGFHSRRFQYK